MFMSIKIMQIEGRTTSLLDCYAEMQLILYKDNAKLVLFLNNKRYLCNYYAKES